MGAGDVGAGFPVMGARSCWRRPRSNLYILGNPDIEEPQETHHRRESVQ